jgi:hypothetical protein
VSRREVEEKFAANMSGLLGAGAADRLQSLAARLDGLANATEIIDIMAAPVG